MGAPGTARWPEYLDAGTARPQACQSHLNAASCTASRPWARETCMAQAAAELLPAAACAMETYMDQGLTIMQTSGLEVRCSGLLRALLQMLCTTSCLASFRTRPAVDQSYICTVSGNSWSSLSPRAAEQRPCCCCHTGACARLDNPRRQYVYWPKTSNFADFKWDTLPPSDSPSIVPPGRLHTMRAAMEVCAVREVTRLQMAPDGGEI